MAVPLSAATHGLSLGSVRRAVTRTLPAFFEQALVRRLFALRLEQIGEGAALRFQHGEIGAGTERVLAGGQNRALDAGLVRDAFDDCSELLHYLGVDHVLRAS